MHDHNHRHNHGRGHRNGHHHHDHSHDHVVGVSGYGLAPAAGHNAAAQVAQWQEPHAHPHDHPQLPEPDFDLIEASFAESFPKASDPTSFLRLAQIPFVGRHSDGRVLRLLRVEFEQATDVGAITPHVGGETLRYDPLPAQMISRRQRLSFVYQDGEGVVRLTLAEARALSVDTA
jgi:hypothetical protein